VTRKLKYHVATSLDGAIADAEGGFTAFLSEGDHIPDYLESLHSYGDVLMGRHTYEVGLEFGVTDPYPYLESYVFSRSMKESPNPRVTLVATDPAAFVATLKQQPGRDIYLCGGADLASTLLEANLIDEILIKLNPVLIGAGIPLFRRLAEPRTLKLIGTKVYESGVVLLSYCIL
jgi:dihydrofolate reductase